jgi:hypothetical protein
VLIGYSDSDLGGDVNKRRSTEGMAFYLNESLISWCSQKQKTVALSSCESEFVAAIAAAMQALWLRTQLSELTAKKPRPCLDALQKLKFFHSLSITSIFGPMHEVVNVGKKITNYTV